MKQGLFIDLLNSLFGFTQRLFSNNDESNSCIDCTDNCIYLSILSVLVLSMFVSSDILGLLALLTFALTILKMFVKKGEKIEINLFEMFILFYFLAVVVSLAGSSLFALSLKGFSKTLTYLAFYFSLVQYFKSNIKKIPLTMLVIGVCAAIQGCIGFMQNFIQVGEISTWQDVSNINPEDVMTRVYGTLLPFNPNLYGGYLIAALPCLFGVSFINLSEKKYILSGVFGILSLLTSIAIILSGCRGAYIGLLCIFILIFFFFAKYIWDNNLEKLKTIYIYMVSTLGAFALGAIIFVSSLRTRIFSIFAMRGDSSTSFRFNVYQSAIQMAKDNWLLGIGVGNQNFREIYGLYMRTGFDALSAYCVFLELMVESGIFALIFFVAFLITLLVKAFKLIFKSNCLTTRFVLMTSVTTIIAVMLHGFVDTVFFRPQIQFLFWTIVSFVSATLYFENKECCGCENCRD